LGEDDKTVESKLKFLSENGLVVRDAGSNKWKITDLGKIQLAELRITSLG
jgi:predicted transcriptional regulator